MGCWIPGPENMSWPANQRPQPEPSSGGYCRTGSRRKQSLVAVVQPSLLNNEPSDSHISRKRRDHQRRPDYRAVRRLIINCGRVRDPQGLDGDQGPMALLADLAKTETRF